MRAYRQRQSHAAIGWWVGGVAISPRPPPSYGGDSHHHLAVGGGAEPGVVGPQLAQDVQDGVATVVVENSPEPPAPTPSSCSSSRARSCSCSDPSTGPAAAAAAAHAVGAAATAAAAPRLAAGAQRVPQVLGLLVVQNLPLLIDSLPSLEDPVHRGTLVDYESWSAHQCRTYGGER